MAWPVHLQYLLKDIYDAEPDQIFRIRSKDPDPFQNLTGPENWGLDIIRSKRSAMTIENFGKKAFVKVDMHLLK
jgi:hypothetical protein